jgi:selT/selW/selH-like putative selenoprotein
LQEAIKTEFGVSAELRGGHGGVFDVELDGHRIYSKDETFRFPTNEEVVASIRAAHPA